MLACQLWFSFRPTGFDFVCETGAGALQMMFSRFLPSGYLFPSTRIQHPRKTAMQKEGN